MIRERRAEDLDRLCAVLEALQYPASLVASLVACPVACPVAARDELRRWLEVPEAERSWVFDQAPVTVAPTGNVAGHVQVRHVRVDRPLRDLLAAHGASADRALVIGRLFVRPDPHAEGVGRFLLREAVRYVREQGRVPVLGADRHGLFSDRFCERVGFEPLRRDGLTADDPTGTGIGVMVHTGVRRRR